VEPAPGQESVWDHLAFYPDRLECYVDGKRVRTQRGGFYGGWITGDIGGPFKGEPGTEGWKREQYTLSDPHRALF
jgi:hypothetical protein